MIIGIFELISAIIGFFVQRIAYERLRKRYPEGITAKNYARILQIIAVAVSGLILGSLTLNFVSLSTTLFYVIILAVNTILVNVIVKIFNFLEPETRKRINDLKPKLFAFFSSLSSARTVESIIEWWEPYSLSVKSFVKRLKERFDEIINHPITKALLFVLDAIYFLIEAIVYPYIVRPLMLELFIYVLKFIEKSVDWLTENILETLLGEVFTKIVQFISVVSISVPRYLLEVIRNILDKLFKK